MILRNNFTVHTQHRKMTLRNGTSKFIFLKELQLNIPILIHNKPLAMFLIPIKIPFIPAPIGVEETSESLSFAMGPITLVNVLDYFVLDFAIEPVVCAETMLQVVKPFAFVLLVLCKPVHNSVSVFLVILPFALVDVAGCVFHFAFAVANALVEIAFV
jgi:hypothetical protein